MPDRLLGWLDAAWSDDVDPPTPEEALAWFGEGDVVWLDSTGGGSHLMGTGTAVVVDSPERAIDQIEDAQRAKPGVWCGWFGYEAGVASLGLPPHPTRFPQAAWLRLDRWIVWDGERCQLQGDHAWRPPGLVTASRGAKVGGRPTSVEWSDDERSYLERIERCQREIAAGEAYVLCLTTSVETSPIDALASYRALRRSSEVPHGGFLRIGGTSLASASPESFLRVRGRTVATSPIKGTRRRRAGDDDAVIVAELAADEKERAENLMITDLCRNDLSRVCEVGSVRVPRLFGVDSYPTVHQLTTTVQGQLADGKGAFDALRALFPAGSMTGAPKRRAVELLTEIEQRGRGLYSGCFGLMAPHGAELAMVIRSIVADAHGAHVGVGGGITALSEPAAEWAEAQLKSETLIAALRAK